MKTCSNPNCLEVNPQREEDFAIERDGKYSWRRGRCRSCRAISQEALRKRDQEKYNAYMREYNAKNKGTRKWKDRYKNKVLKSRYGITLDQYNQMFESQNGGCALCGKGPLNDNALNVDHHHVTGKVRALLCHACNRDLSILDDPERLAKAQAYLAKHS